MEDIRRALPVHPVSEAIAMRAGLMDGMLAARGVHVALSDLLIGVTALELGYRVATHNVKHFVLIPGLEVASL
jgi:predicted nucleic acid-binding protein